MKVVCQQKCIKAIILENRKHKVNLCSHFQLIVQRKHFTVINYHQDTAGKSASPLLSEFKSLIILKGQRQKYTAV